MPSRRACVHLPLAPHVRGSFENTRPTPARLAPGSYNARMRKSERYQAGDNPIDWSSFDEPSGRQGPVPGSTALRIVSAIMLVGAVVAVIFGCMGMGSALSSMDLSSPDTAFLGSGMLRSGALIGVGALTLIPAAFGFQVAGTPVSFVAPTVLGIIGILLSVVLQVLSIAICLVGSSDAEVLQPAPWIVLLLPAFAYLFCVVRVHKAANRRGVARRRPSKDELWDEDKIWQ